MSAAAFWAVVLVAVAATVTQLIPLGNLIGGL